MISNLSREFGEYIWLDCEYIFLGFSAVIFNSYHDNPTFRFSWNWYILLRTLIDFYRMTMEINTSVVVEIPSCILSHLLCVLDYTARLWNTLLYSKEVPSRIRMPRDNRPWRLNREVLLRIGLVTTSSIVHVHTAKSSKLEPIEFLRIYLKDPCWTYHRGQDPDILSSQPSTHSAWYWWWQGRLRRSCPPVKSSEQTAQVVLLLPHKACYWELDLIEWWMDSPITYRAIRPR